jgi:hypothetical protein
MPFDPDVAAKRLLQLRHGKDLKNFRRGLDAAEAKAVIRHPTLQPIDRACISLAIQFASDPAAGRGYDWVRTYGFGDSEIIQLDLDLGECNAAKPME